jgi:hypothetical protein
MNTTLGQRRGFGTENAQGLDNVDFIGPENINRPASDKVPVH